MMHTKNDHWRQQELPLWAAFPNDLPPPRATTFRTHMPTHPPTTLRMTTDIPLGLPVEVKVEMVCDRLRRNTNDMCVAQQIPLPSAWCVHLEEPPVAWPIDSHTLRVQVYASFYGVEASSF